jgi:hypothetical protein
MKRKFVLILFSSVIAALTILYVTRSTLVHTSGWARVAIRTADGRQLANFFGSAT